MPDSIWGIDQDGKIIPQTPLPEGLQVRITIPEEAIIPEDLRAEIDAWSLRNAEGLALVEELAEEMGRHEVG